MHLNFWDMEDSALDKQGEGVGLAKGGERER